jgi:23S rRNA (guanosine2251-2'-O)-methyltransferase
MREFKRSTTPQKDGSNKGKRDFRDKSKQDFKDKPKEDFRGRTKPDFKNKPKQEPRQEPKQELKQEVINKEVREDIIEGRNAVIEALKSDRTIESILVAKGDVIGSISIVLAIAKEKGIVIKEVDRRKLDSMSTTGSHQGVIAIVTPYKYFEVEEILAYAEQKGEKPFILVLDEIEDPHNLGSIIRTAETSGVHGIIISKRRNVGVTPTVSKTSAGAIEYMRIAKVPNINSIIDEFKKKGIWVYGADMEGESYCFQTKFSGAIALVIGSEGRGISKLTKEKCDVLVKIPMVGNISSLNASVAAGIMMYEVLKQKME